MKYESNILKRLIDTYGVVGNPRYISEIIKEFIVRGKERFPELFTYQSDWLAHIDEFGLNPSYTVSYTGQSIYAPNTLERPVKSAILKGSTKYRDIDTGEFLETFEEGRNLELVSVRMPGLKTVSGFNLLNPNAEPIAYQGNDVLHPDYFKAKFGDSFSVTKKTSGELWCSLFCYDSDKNLIKAYYQNNHSVPRTITLNDDSLRDVAYVRFECAKWAPFKDIMLNYGEQMPFAEYSGEYKTNILTVNEEVELRGVGDVKDELDLLTGELTQRIGEIVLNGSEEGWIYDNRGSTTAIGYIEKYFTTPPTNAITNYFSLIENRPEVFWNAGRDYEMFCVNDTSLAFRIEKTKLKTLDSNGIKEWLSQNNLIIQYDLATPIIKTVDLTILDQNGQNVKQLMSFNGGTHFITGSLEGSPLPSVSVSVETDLEETLKVCSIEGNTM